MLTRPVLWLITVGDLIDDVVYLISCTYYNPNIGFRWRRYYINKKFKDYRR